METVTKDGSYSVNLEPGTYQISTKNKIWYPARRAPFSVSAGSQVVINVAPPLHITGISTTVTGEIIEKQPPPKYDTIKQSPADSLYAVVEFREKSRSVEATRYNWATLTFDHLTVSARILDVVRQDDRVVVRASGAWLDDNGQRSGPSSVTINIKGAVAAVTRSE